MPIALIAAVADNWVIGEKGRVPWRSVEDMRWFREVTMGNACLMGRKTWEGLRAPLGGRRNIVLTRNAQYRAEGAEVAHDLEALLNSFKNSQENLFVCGGGEVYSAAMPQAERIYLTEVHLSPVGDATFPQFPKEAFTEVFRRESITDPACTFLLLDRFGGREALRR